MRDISLIVLGFDEVIEVRGVKSLEDSEQANLDGRKLLSNETDNWRLKNGSRSQLANKVEVYLREAPRETEVMLLFYKKENGKFDSYGEYIENVTVRCYGPVEDD